MPTGWEQLGSVLGGGIDRQGAFEQGRLRTAQTESALGLARERQLKNITLESQNRERERLRGDLARAGIENHELMGTTMLAGLGDEFKDTTAGMLDNQELNFRNTAADPAQPNSVVQRALGAVGGKPYSPLEAVGTGGFTDITADNPAVQMSDLGLSMIDENVAQTQLSKARAADPDLRTVSGTGGDTPGGVGKPPSGFVANPAFDPSKPINEGNFAFIDARKPVQGAREAVFLDRVIGGASQATSDLNNILRLPVGANAGLIGIGARPGAQITRTMIDGLRNRVSADVVRSYTNQVDNLGRNLSFIESGGLAPSQAFIDAYDSMVMRDGDTEFDYLQKLANIRQTIEVGLQFRLANPRIPAEQKDVMREVIAQTQRLVPITVDQVFVLQYARPGDTLAALTQQYGKQAQTAPGAPAAPGAAPTAPLAPRNDKGWELLEDADGNLAYVSPDGKQIEEVVQ